MNRLADGTEYVGQLGQIAYDETDDKVQCHLCGRWFSRVRRIASTPGARLDAGAVPPRVPAQCDDGGGLGRDQRAARRPHSPAGPGRGAAAPPLPAAEAQKRREIARRRISPGRSLGALRPDLAAELDPTRNGELDPLPAGTVVTAEAVVAL
jgi:hypothetical protein